MLQETPIPYHEEADMAHHIALSEDPKSEGEIGRLTVAAPNSPYGELRLGRISKVPGGLRLRTEAPSGVYVRGEDLFALREMIAEMPEEAFTRPADPVEKPFWSVGDQLVWTSSVSSAHRMTVFERKEDGWHRVFTTWPNKTLGLYHGVDDKRMEHYATTGRSTSGTFKIHRRANA